MVKLNLMVLVLSLAAADVSACRDAYHTHEARLENAVVAFTGRVSGAYLPSIEEVSYIDERDAIRVFHLPRTVRLVLINPLKGSPPKVSELVIQSCNGAINGNIGREVNVYKISGEWHLVAAPTPPSN
jgi:hypothetical protein